MADAVAAKADDAMTAAGAADSLRELEGRSQQLSGHLESAFALLKTKVDAKVGAIDSEDSHGQVRRDHRACKEIAERLVTVAGDDKRRLEALRKGTEAIVADQLDAILASQVDPHPPGGFHARIDACGKVFNEVIAQSSMKKVLLRNDNKLKQLAERYQSEASTPSAALTQIIDALKALAPNRSRNRPRRRRSCRRRGDRCLPKG